MGELPPWHSYSARINLVSSRELEEAPLNKSLLLCSSFLHSFGSAWALGTIFRTMGFFGCMNPCESRTSGILSRRKKQRNSHVSWENGQTGHQEPYSSHTSQLPLVCNRFPSSRGYLTAGPSLLLMQSSHQQVFTSPQLLDKLVGELWLSHGVVQRAWCTDQQAAWGGKRSPTPARVLQLNGGMQCHFL